MPTHSSTSKSSESKGDRKIHKVMKEYKKGELNPAIAESRLQIASKPLPSH